MKSTAARHRVRNYLGTILVGTAAAGLSVVDVAYLAQTTSGRATVREASTLGYRAAGSAMRVVVEHEVAGRTVVASLTTWFHPLSIRRGDIIAIRYRPGEPAEAALDDFWQLHYAAVAAWLLVGAVAAGEAMASAHRRHMDRIARVLSG
jgi:hypothetical protein